MGWIGDHDQTPSFCFQKPGESRTQWMRRLHAIFRDGSYKSLNWREERKYLINTVMSQVPGLCDEIEQFNHEADESTTSQ